MQFKTKTPQELAETLIDYDESMGSDEPTLAAACAIVLVGLVSKQSVIDGLITALWTEKAEFAKEILEQT